MKAEIRKITAGQALNYFEIKFCHAYVQQADGGEFKKFKFFD
jgi:hypothetical protein